MPTHRLQLEKEETYFITFTCYKWLDLFSKTDLYEYFDKWFHYLNANHVRILGYVIMPNHFHGLLHVTDECTKSINQLVGNGKRFLAHEIVSRLKAQNDRETLKILQCGVAKKEANKGKQRQVFRLSFDAKHCFDLNMVETKLDYIHQNPKAGKWNLVKDWSEYPYSSAGYYEHGCENSFITHYKEIWC